ncbi:hypothetical protein [Photobacterium chitinilyticum]|uniref:Uncharacterized protein n=1 Tax=Photobacterium chitinilyticum TaxID=2485123 RepID=A0A444JI87_9GAMM|nr:hypothetical protein [Photobacterium chitinilyticum]RWX52790.1 hypothetical protein EDI28_25395 [Photobacterium chitinilyticum]
MERYHDMIELLETVESNISALQESYKKAQKDEEVKSVLRPLVKSCLEHLRSVLEYSAQDIWSSYNTKSKKLYFPYGKDEALFKANIKRNLPGLIDNNQQAYSIIESIQPFKCGNDWLIELCNQTNFNKHNKLGNQIRQNSDKSTTNVGNLVSMQGGGTVTFSDCVYNGMPLGQGRPAVISGDMTVKEIKASIGIPVPVTREFDWVEFHFENSAVDTLTLIESSYERVRQYVSQLKGTLS